MKNFLLLTATALSATFLWSDFSFAASNTSDGADGATKAAQTCAAIAQSDARLACYDRAYPPIENIELAREAPPEAEFGLSPYQLSERDPDSPRTTKIEASIAVIRMDAQGKRVVALDNGQVWKILEPATRGFLKAGDQTSIRRASLGTFMLLTPAGIALRARRID